MSDTGVTSDAGTAPEAAPTPPPDPPTPAGDGGAAQAPPESAPAEVPAAPPSIPADASFDQLGDFYESLSAEQATPDLTKLRKEHQKYRETYQPIAERFDGIPDEDRQALFGFIDAYRSGDDARAAQIAAYWAQALGGQPQQPQQPQPAGYQQPPVAQPQGRTLDPSDPSAPLTKAEAQRLVMESARAAIQAEREAIAQQRQEAEAKRAAAEQVRATYRDLGFNLDDPVDMARAQTVANYVRLRREQGHQITPQQAVAEIGDQIRPVQAPPPAAPVPPESQALPPAQTDPTEGLTGVDAVVARAKRRLADQGRL